MAGAQQYSADLVKYVLSAIDTKIQTVVRKYIDDKFKNLIVSGDQIAQNSVSGVVLENGTIPKQKIYEFAAEVATIAAAEIESATIDTAQIENLSAYVADIVVASIGTAEIDWAEIASLTAVIASIAVANIESAKIGFAQIYDLVADTALITQGVGGKFFISQLVVTEANMVSLTVGELIVKGSDGLFYKFSVDEAGLPVATLVEVAGDNIADATIAGGNLIEGTITAREINATSIFAQDATILELIADNIDTATLFANETFTGALRTNLIESDIGGYLMIEGDEGVRVSVSDTVAGLQTSLDVVADGFSLTSSQISAIEETIDGLATTDYVDAKAATLSLDAYGLSLRISDAEGRLSGVDDDISDLQDFRTTQETMISGDIEGVHVKNVTSGAEVLLAADKLSFKDNTGYEAAYLSDSKMFVPSVEVTDSLQIGGIQFKKYPSGRVTLKAV